MLESGKFLPGARQALRIVEELAVGCDAEFLGSTVA
jgi:hypothetical protein